MKKYSVKAQQWIASAELANEIVDNEVSFEVTAEQKEFMQDDQMRCVDEFMEGRFSIVPHTYMFEPFWDGQDDVFICTAYFGQTGYFKPKSVALELSQCDLDMIGYALNHTDWSEYNPEEFGGEDAEVAANIHFVDIMEQLGID